MLIAKAFFPNRFLSQALEINPQREAKREGKRLILCLTPWVEASRGVFWHSKPQEHCCFRHHNGSRFNFKKEIRAKTGLLGTGKTHETIGILANLA